MDIRVIRTRAALRQSLLECMKEKMLKDITVAELSRIAGLDRTTFYKHYKSIDEILEELEREQLDRFSTMLRENTKSGEDLLRDILDSIDNAKKLYRTKDGGVIPERFKTGLVETTKEYGVKAWREKLPKLEPLEAELAYEALLAGTLQAAISADSKANREKVVRVIMDLIKSYIASHA